MNTIDKGRTSLINWLNYFEFIFLIIVLYVFGIIIYSSVTITGLRTIVVPVPQDTEEDRVEALKVLSAGNTLIILCLVGVLLLQVSEKGAKRLFQPIDNLLGFLFSRGAKNMQDEYRSSSKPKLKLKHKNRKQIKKLYLQRKRHNKTKILFSYLPLTQINLAPTPAIS